VKKQGFIKGSLILMISAVIAKGLGALFKIPLTNMLGGVGMGFFSCAYSLFLPVYALSVTGLSAAVARLTSQSIALEMYDNARKIRKTALKLFSSVGFFGMIFIASAAKPFAVYIAKSPDAQTAIMLIAPSVLFGCITAVERGYYEGLCNMYPTAFSQLAESIVKTAAGLLLCALAVQHSDTLITFFPKGTDIKAVTASAGILGVTLSSVGSALFFPIMRIFIKNDNKFGDKTLISSHDISAELIKIALPVGISSLVTNFTSVIDLATIISCCEMYSGYSDLSAQLGHENFPQFIYGSFTGIAVTIFNIIPSVTNMLGKGILPSVTYAWEKKDKCKLQKNTSQALLAALIIAVPAAVGIGILAKPLLLMLFPLQTDEISICVKALQYLMPGMVFLCVSFPVFSMLQATGNSSVPLKIMLIGALVKLIGNLTLIKHMGIDGAALSTTLCYTVIIILSLSVYLKLTGIKLKAKPFLSVIYSGILCGASAMLCMNILSTIISDIPALFASIAVGGGIYLLSLWLLNVQKNDRC
jgi:stage V sporulation protein B